MRSTINNCDRFLLRYNKNQENRKMAQIYNSIDDNPLRQAIYRISWNLDRHGLIGTCPNDALFQTVIFNQARVTQLEESHIFEGTFTYQCGKVAMPIQFVQNRHINTVLFWLKLGEKATTSDIPLQLLTPQTQWLNKITWHIKEEQLKGTCPDNSLFRGVVFDAYPENDLYPTEGEYFYESDNVKKRISWFRDDDLKTSESRIILILPLYEELEKRIKLLTDKQLKKFKLDFDRFLGKNQCYFDKNSLNRFQYSLVETGQLTSEQAEQLWNYIEAAYK